MRDWPLFHLNNNWSQRLILARECFAEIRAERTEPSLTASQTVQAPLTPDLPTSALLAEQEQGPEWEAIKAGDAC